MKTNYPYVTMNTPPPQKNTPKNTETNKRTKKTKHHHF